MEILLWLRMFWLLFLSRCCIIGYEMVFWKKLRFGCLLLFGIGCVIIKGCWFSVL